MLGVLAGLLAAALIEALDRTVKSATQADELFAAPLLALVPRHRSPQLALATDDRGPFGEPYRSLRTSLRFLDPDRPLDTLLVTSPTPGDGKTTTAANLAIALALSGEHVVVVDADLRRATLADSLGLERAVGLTSLVLGTAPLNEVLQSWGPNLDVLASGPLPPNPSEILGSRLFHNVLRELSDIADMVIIDVPPVLPVADAVALAAHVDGVLLVARYGSTLRNAAQEARRRLDTVNANVLGYVLNAVPPRESRDYYADYLYDSREARQASPAAATATLTPEPLRATAPAQTAPVGPITRLRTTNGKPDAGDRRPSPRNPAAG
jgi:capsular exopolysaccharide synthesis family protein